MKRLISAIPFLLPSLAMADTTVVCPDDYPTALLATKGVPTGWNGIAHVAGLRLVLSSAGIVAGPPDREIQALLRGEEKKTRDGYTSTFSALTRFTDPNEKWVFCAYGIGGDVQLLQRVPDDTDTCILDARRNFQKGHDIRFTCSPKR